MSEDLKNVQSAS